MIEKIDCPLPISKQCKMVDISRSSYYNYVQNKNACDQNVKNKIAEIYACKPSYGSRRITEILKRSGMSINRKRVQRLMRAMRIQGICPKQKLSMANRKHKKYPFIARDKPIISINQAFSTDITYIKTIFGTVYLVAVIDWYSRLILSWNMSNTMGEEFCIEALKKALQKGIPEIFNTDQGSQFTSHAFTSVLLEYNIKPSMDGKGRATDNAQIERFWRSVKWEELFLYEPKNFIQLQQQINNYISFYNHERPHQSLNYKTPSEAHFNLDRKLIDENYNFIYSEKELKYVAHW